MGRIIRARISVHKFLSILVLQTYPFTYILVGMDKDISTLLKEIKAATGWSEPRLATELGTAQSTVNRILNGQQDCKVSTYRAITALHKRCTEGAENLGRRKDDVPPGRDS